MRSRRDRRAPAWAVLALVAAAAIMALSGCGGSSKPQYCSDRSDLEQSIKDIGNVNVAQSGGLQALQSQLQKVEANAKKLESSAKGDFPTESTAIETSVSALKSAVQGLPSSPSRQQLVTVATEAKAVVTAFQNFKNATDSKCS